MATEPFFLGFLLSLIIFPQPVQEAVALGVHHMLTARIHPPGSSPAQGLLLCSSANSTLGDIVDSSSFAMVTFMGCSFLSTPIPLMSTLSPFLYIPIYVAKGATWHPERPGEQY